MLALLFISLLLADLPLDDLGEPPAPSENKEVKKDDISQREDYKPNSLIWGYNSEHLSL
jgi:hypothetical protein